MKAPVQYVPDFLPDATALLAALRNLVWEKRDAPRMEYYCNDLALPYTYGAGRGRRTYEPHSFDSQTGAIRDRLVAFAGCNFEVCFLNRYMDARDHLGWHSDDSPEMDDARPIGVISLGAAREIWFRPVGESGQEKIERLVLEHGSLCLMAPGMQDVWQHRIPKASRLCGERISLTFRGYV